MSIKQAEAAVTAAKEALIAANDAREAAMEAVRNASATLHDLRVAADAALPRVRLFGNRTGDPIAAEYVFVRRTKASLFVRRPGEQSSERRFTRPGPNSPAAASWYEHGKYGSTHIPAADIAALGEVSDE